MGGQVEMRSYGTRKQRDPVTQLPSSPATQPAAEGRGDASGTPHAFDNVPPSRCTDGCKEQDNGNQRHTPNARRRHVRRSRSRVRVAATGWATWRGRSHRRRPFDWQPRRSQRSGRAR